MALQKERMLRRLILAWDENGSFLGGQADYLDRFVDDVSGLVEGRQDVLGEPISGAFQPGSLIENVLSATEQQRLQTIVAEKARADQAIVARNAALANADALKIDRDRLRAELDTARTRP